MFKDVLYYCLYMNGNSYSYSLANINMLMNNIFDISDSSLIRKRNTIKFIHFKEISDRLIKYIYKDETPRIIAVDGTYIPLSIELKNMVFTVLKKNILCCINKFAIRYY